MSIINNTEEANQCNEQENLVKMIETNRAEKPTFIKKLRSVIRRSDKLFDTTKPCTFLRSLIYSYHQGRIALDCIKVFLIESSGYESATHPGTPYINHIDTTGYSALMYAVGLSCDEKMIQCVELLLQYGADVNSYSTNKNKPPCSPLMFALSSKFNEHKVATAKLLIDYKTNLNYRLENGTSYYVLVSIFQKEYTDAKGKVSCPDSVLDIVRYLVVNGAVVSDECLLLIIHFSRTPSDCAKILSALTNNLIEISTENICFESLLLSVCKYLNNEPLTNAVNNAISLTKLVSCQQSTFILIYYCRNSKTFFDKLAKKISDPVINANDSLFFILFTLFKNPDYQLIKYLIDRGLNINAVGKDSDPIVTDIVREMISENKSSIDNVIQALTFLLDNNLNINIEGGLNFQLFSQSLEYGSYQLVKFIIDNGVDFKLYDSEKSSLLGKVLLFYESSLTLDKLKIVKLLINSGANPNYVCGNNAESPLGILCYMDIPDDNEELIKESLDCVDLFLQKGANPRHRCLNSDVHADYNVNAFMCACVKSSCKYNFACVKLLIDKINFNETFDHNNYLQACVKLLRPDLTSQKTDNSVFSSMECIKLLLEKNASPNNDSIFNKDRPLITACELSKYPQHMKCVKLLLKNGADINVQGNGGKTALHIVCANLNKKSSLECLEYLINKGKDIDLNVLDGESLTPLGSLCKLFKQSRENNDIEKISPECFIRALDILLSVGVDVNIYNVVDGETPLMLLCDNDLSEFKDNVDAIQIITNLVTASKDTIEHKNAQGYSAYDLYNQRKNTIFDDHQLSFLKGTSVLTGPKPAR